MEKPLVSICIPGWNCAAFVNRAIESALGQTYANIEVIFVDDGSTDNTAEVIKRYLEKDKRLKYFKNEKNLGFGENLFRSYELASGEWVQHLSHDDWLDLDFIQKKVETFERFPHAGLIANSISSEAEVSGKMELLNITRKKGGLYSKEFIFRNFYRNSGWVGLFCMARKKDVMENKMTEIPGVPEYAAFYRKGVVIDSLLFLNILSRYDSIFYIPDVVYHGFSHDKNTSKSYGLSRSDWAQNLMFMEMSFKGFDHFFSERAKEGQRAYRAFVGNDVLITTLFDSVFGRASGVLIKKLLGFFKNYRSEDKFLTAISFIPQFLQRIWSRISKKWKNQK
jgi:glycosyltransferase involved in cell wall biosynthesis